MRHTGCILMMAPFLTRFMKNKVMLYKMTELGRKSSFHGTADRKSKK